MAPQQLNTSIACAHRLPSTSCPLADCRLALALAVALFMPHGTAGAVAAQNQRGVSPEDQPIGNYYALVIGIDKYPPPMKELKTAVNDAKVIAKLLAERYGFQVQLLLDADASHNKILNSINQYRTALKENDSLLIYYAGHGYTDPDAEKAYWLPVDAESGMSANHIIADELTSDVRALPSRHVLIISDSCYSGGLARDADEPAQTGNNPALLNRMLHSKSRTLMASGGDEPVADSGTDGHSVFAYAVIRALDQANEPMFTATDLFYNSVRKQVAERSAQLPQYSTIRNSMAANADINAGDFVFTRKLPPAPEIAATPSEAQSKGMAFYQANRFAEALPLFMLACNGGQTKACVYLGEMYQGGLAVGMDQVQADTLYRKSCDAGYQVGCMHLSRQYAVGNGAPKDTAKAEELYRTGASLARKACDVADAEGCFDLGLYYENGWGVGKKDSAQAADFYRKACDGGEPRGCTNLAGMYDTGKGVDQKPEQAVALYRKACDAGNNVGCRNLGIEYARGNGVAKDMKQAAALLQKSCDANEAISCSLLGSLYLQGDVLEKNLGRAAALFQKACDGGVAVGCSNLGLLYEGGLGVARDVDLALRLYRQGCGGGLETACQNMRRLQP